MRPRVLIASILLATAMAAVPRADVFDRILAVVNGEIVTLSDADAALRFSLVPADVSTDPIDAALQRLVDRRVLLEEVERYQPPEPAAAAVDAELARLRAAFKEPLPFEAALQQSGLTLDQLRGFARESLRIESYLQQRLSAAVQPGDDELVRYYREHGADFTLKGALRPFEDVREQVRAAVVRARRDAFLRETVEGLRRRASIVVLYMPRR